MKINSDASPQVILASASEARSALLKKAGLHFDVIPAQVDESAIKIESIKQNISVDEVAIKLATLKAQRVSNYKPGALVIGCDQLLECEGQWYDKASDREHADQQLRSLRGKRHVLVTAATIIIDGVKIWGHIESPELYMRNFDDEFINYYLNLAQEDAYGCVGAYRLESFGCQLFSKVNGDYFTILGLPLLPLLEFLRKQGVIKV
tara:strand:- start:554 stop:1171 length:618 start_codon:yes stop_codon:yes gene_type:complete